MTRTRVAAILAAWFVLSNFVVGPWLLATVVPTLFAIVEGLARVSTR